MLSLFYVNPPSPTMVTQEMKDRFLDTMDCNVIVVDWRGGNVLPYSQATANCRVVGAEIALLVKTAEVACVHVTDHYIYWRHHFFFQWALWLVKEIPLNNTPFSLSCIF
ncbi:hypothetical protein HPB48_000726 [Haemaphysalis longicornis]|uniref:Lipase domain-containing protein n=1 Tax=Haemaphysalis longicornis TaxID=44386 RepID=A0A9J6GXE4_HAELO|nr:hypothetical protein HPB48_000726 [Haemaphysalis longicornis]